MDNIDQKRAVGQNFQGSQEFERQMLVNLEMTSRTSKGISDTTSSADKPSLSSEGEALADSAAVNFKRAMVLAWENRSQAFNTPEQVRQFVELLAATVSDGLLKEGQGLWRTWKTKFNQTPPENIEQEVDEFCQQLSERLQRQEDSVATAAWVEKRFDSQIHPLADGCGRTTKLLSAVVLARNNHPLPHYRNRDEYYEHVEKSFPEWEKYYRTLFTEGESR